MQLLNAWMAAVCAAKVKYPHKPLRKNFYLYHGGLMVSVCEDNMRQLPPV